MQAPALRIGQIYYMVQYQAEAPVISSYEYKGAADGKPHMHFFKAVGLSDANLFLEDSDLKRLVDIAGLRTALRASHAS